ncbi:MAG: phosphoribosylanthranilate isomerase [Verrucomicrobia bacterium]|nr:phosphoribosylanthranilate isomerase [Verrucomicrobiota bacterium]
MLLDSYDPKTIGGTGKTCDWSQAREMVQALETPVLLAGGLTPDNVAVAIKTVGPWGVDVSSGVEIEPGVKDIAKVEAFITACRAS